MKWKDVREWFRIIHLWIGVIGGIFIFIICLTGTILVYQDDVIQGLNGDVFYVEPSTETIAITEIINKVEQESQQKVVRFVKEKDQHKAWKFFTKVPGAKGRPETLFVNPYTNKILGNGKDLVGKDFFMFNFKLHRWFLMDMEVGRPIVGFFTIAFLVAMFTGLVIWFPKKIKNYKRGFKVKFNANWKRVNHEFHNAFGLYAAIFLIIMGITGLFWSYEWYRNCVSDLIGTKVFDRSKEEVLIEPNNSENYNFNQVIASIEKDLSTYDILAFSIPMAENQALEVNAYKTGFAALSLPDKFYYDSYKSQQVRVDLFEDLAWNKKIAKSIHDLHMGFLFGPLNKIIFFITSIIASLLPITGFLMWGNRKKWWKKSPKKSNR